MFHVAARSLPDPRSAVGKYVLTVHSVDFPARRPITVSTIKYMSAPSFSSFPSSFSSFPDFDPGPSTRTATPKDKERDKDKEKKRSKKEKGVRGRRERKRHEKHNDNVLEKDRTRSRRHSEDRAYEGYNDERLKAEEDSRSRKDGDYSAMDFLSAPLYITDRKGDPLNVQFGGLHAGHVPKYHQAGCECAHVFHGDN